MTAPARLLHSSSLGGEGFSGIGNRSSVNRTLRFGIPRSIVLASLRRDVGRKRPLRPDVDRFCRQVTFQEWQEEFRHTARGNYVGKRCNFPWMDPSCPFEEFTLLAFWLDLLGRE